MRVCLFLLLAPLRTAAYDVTKLHGVVPSLLSRYSSSKAQTWNCLDGSKEIPWSAVNDDYCDCTDGSDEPGTGACSTSTFYCQNLGHIGATIPASRVRDGLCEPECCDGSDERPGVCSNTCADDGIAHRRLAAAEQKLRITGSKIRSSYIAFARKEKVRLEDTISAARKKIDEHEEEILRLKHIVDQTEALSVEVLESKKRSPLFVSLTEHGTAIKSLRREHRKLLEREKTLSDILEALRHGYNPNYQDMAVLEAVRGWEYLANIRHNNEEVDGDSVDDIQEQIDASSEEDVWSARELDERLDALAQADYVSILLEHDRFMSDLHVHSSLYDVTAYLPDSLLPQYEALRDSAISWLQRLGLAPKHQLGVSTASATKAKDALAQAESDLAKLKEELDHATQDLEELFDPKFFGAEGEWRKLANQCLSKDTGDYTYEVCLFGEAKQKPNHGGQTFSLGHFSSWNDSATAGSPAYYSLQMYTLGTKCWNGPQRSVKLSLSCGMENALLTIQELEKCEYQFTGTSPALCLPLNTQTDRDEL